MRKKVRGILCEGHCTPASFPSHLEIRTWAKEMQMAKLLGAARPTWLIMADHGCIFKRIQKAPLISNTSNTYLDSIRFLDLFNKVQ